MIDWYNLILKYAPYLAGYLSAIGLSYCLMNYIYEELWNEIKNESKDQDYRLHRWYGAIIGNLEIIMYISALLLNKYEFIGIWLAFKVVGRWERSRIESNNKGVDNLGKLQTHAIYSIFTIGNALSIIYAVVGWQIILLCKENQILEMILFISSVITASFLLVFFARRQSKRIKIFKEYLENLKKEKRTVPKKEQP